MINILKYVYKIGVNDNYKLIDSQTDDVIKRLISNYKRVKTDYIEFKEVALNMGVFLKKFVSIVTEVLNEFDFNEMKKNIVDKVITRNEDLINKFIEEEIFPPIFYSDDNFILKIKKIDLEDENLKKYYSESMRMWIKKEYPDHIKVMINDIIESYNEGKIYTTTITLFTLLEYRINIAKLKPINGYQAYKTTLKERVFEHEVTKEHLLKYIDEIIFKDTRADNIKSLTRHVVHGDRLDLITYDSMMSLIFLYDFINLLLKIDTI